MRTKSRAIALSALLVACGSHAVHPSRPDHAEAITDERAWTSLAATLQARTVANVEEVKFVIDLSDRDASGAPHVYFLDSNRYDSHYDFASAHLDREGGRISGPMNFYVSEYRRPERRFWLGSLVRYRDADRFVLEILAGDTMSGTALTDCFALVRARVFFGEVLAFHPISDLHERTLATLAEGTLPIVRDAALHESWSYEPLEMGMAYGYVRLVHGHLDPASVRPNQILVMEEVPDDVPVCAAMITSRFQAPLAHIALLSANRGSPDAAVRDAITDARFTSLEGRLARLVVSETELRIEEAPLAEAESFWSGIRPSEPFSPRIDAEEARLVALSDLRIDDVDFAGAKAANLGEATQLPGVEVPRGFVVPVRYFMEHLARNGIRAEVLLMLADPAFASDAGVRATRLEALRARIASAPVDPTLVTRVRESIATLAATGRLRFRSSTNAEDLPGFNGAGLYSSAIVAHDPTDAEIASALARIWASVFNLGAHEEREWYRIDHARVAMAVLVQASVDDGIANGVALTANPFDERRPGVLIDAQTMDGSVTGAGSDEVPEQFLVLTYLPEREPEVLSRSSRTHGAPILSDAEVLRLTDVLVTLHAHFEPHFPEGSNAVDVEFLIAGPEHRPIIVQARPFTVTYSH